MIIWLCGWSWLYCLGRQNICSPSEWWWLVPGAPFCLNTEQHFVCLRWTKASRGVMITRVERKIYWKVLSISSSIQKNFIHDVKSFSFFTPQKCPYPELLFLVGKNNYRVYVQGCTALFLQDTEIIFLQAYVDALAII